MIPSLPASANPCSAAFTVSRRGAVDRRVGEAALLGPVEHLGVDLGRRDGHAGHSYGSGVGQARSFTLGVSTAPRRPAGSRGARLSPARPGWPPGPPRSPGPRSARTAARRTGRAGQLLGRHAGPDGRRQDVDPLGRSRSAHDLRAQQQAGARSLSSLIVIGRRPGSSRPAWSPRCLACGSRSRRPRACVVHSPVRAISRSPTLVTAVPRTPANRASRPPMLMPPPGPACSRASRARCAPARR